MTIGKGKRPRDPNQLAKWIVDHSTGQSSERQPEQPVHVEPIPVSTISQYMATIGRKGGQIGGKRRLKTMSKIKGKKRSACASVDAP
jgi:hypothetical protein